MNAALEPFIAPVKLSFPLINSSSGNQFCSGYFKINFYDYDRSQQSTPLGLAPSKEFYLNGLFRPLDMTQTITQAEGNLHFTIWHEEVLVNNSARGLRDCIASIGIGSDAHNTALLAFPICYVPESRESLTPSILDPLCNAAEHFEGLWVQKLATRFEGRTVARHPLFLTGSSDAIDVIVFEHSAKQLSGMALQFTEALDASTFMIMNNAQYHDLVATITSSQTPESIPTNYIETNQMLIDFDTAGALYSKQILNFSTLKKNVADLEKVSTFLNLEVYSSGS